MALGEYLLLSTHGRRLASPQPEETTASDYFATKKKSLRSTPSRARQSAKSHPAITKDIIREKPESRGSQSRTPQKRSVQIDQPGSGRSVRSSTRAKKQQAYAEAQSSSDDHSNLLKDADFGEDVYQDGLDARHGNAGGKKDDDDTSEEAPPPKKTNGRTLSGRKRKSADLSDDEEPSEHAKHKNGKVPKTSKPSRRKSRTTPSKNDPAPEDAEMQGILDNIPTVEAPTPPPRDAEKKFDFKANAARSQPAPFAGSKEIPNGAENCLSGLTFVFTGLLDSLGRDEGQDLVKRYGGKVTTAPSSKTDYVVLGNDAGPKKLETIAKHKLKTINEDGLFALVKTMPANGGTGTSAIKANEKREAEERKTQKAAEEMAEEMAKEERRRVASLASKGKAQQAPDPAVEDRLWTVKYAPTQVSQICGNKAPVDKLHNWLRDWPKNAKSNFKKGGPDGSGLYRAAMIHGSPGIGKTTAAHLVAGLEGYDVVESNASDTRSKKLIENGLKGVLDTTSLFGYIPSADNKIAASKRKLVLIMDEVDGMSAGDRGGVGAMASVCRKTRIPIILICNERKLPKMKPFDHVTFDIPFRKPTTDQVRGRIMTILFREGMSKLVPPNVINALIEGAGADIRRIINMISTVKLDQSTMNFDEGKKMTSSWEKNVILRPWDITQKILGGGLFAPNSKVSINEMAELYFNDHEFSYLMLQENYLHTNPILSLGVTGKEKDKKVLDLVDQAAESISNGDLVDSLIHGPQQHWSLMPLHAVFSFVQPASFMSGNTGGRVGFTSWLGNNSKGGEFCTLKGLEIASLMCT